ncbi:MAG: hypothetical protein GY856_18775 [bacterium]|nr:hypothetical protein [bacterium]
MRQVKRFLIIVALAALASGLAGAAAAGAAEHRLGLGVHYWRTVDDLADEGFEDIEDDGLSYLVSYQYVPRGLFRFEIDLEYYGDGFAGSTESAFSPVGYIVVGSGFYVAAGVGVTISDGLEDDVSDPFFSGRVGFVFDLLPGVGLDLNANYRANAFSELDDADTNAITLAALVRFSL